MLKELEPESRLERIADWLQTFGTADSDPTDQSSGPAVLYQVLNDVTVQKDFEASHREALSAAVRDNLQKFPVEMQAMLERVGTLTGSGRTGAAGLSDWRRRHNQPMQQEAPTLGPGAKLLFGVGPETPSEQAADAQAPSLSTPVTGAPTPEEAEEALAQQAPEEEEAAGASEAFNVAAVDPQLLMAAREQVLKLLELNSEGCPKHFVRARLKQLGIPGLPIAALGEGVFFSGADVYLRQPAAPAPAVPQSASRLPVTEELQQQMAELVREAGGRMPISQLAERLQWQPGTARHGLHGPLRKALAQVPELFFEPEKVFTLEMARRLVLLNGLMEEVEEPAEDAATADTTQAAAVPYSADPFAELITTVMSWLQQAGGTLEREAVLPLIKAMGFKTRAVIHALSRDVFWSHPESECEVLLRTAAGMALHHKPLPSNYLHETVKRNLVAEIRQMGVKAKSDKLAGLMGWNAKSELRRTYGALRIVLGGLQEVFYDASKLYLKQVLEGVVEWPVGKDGRIGPHASQEPVVQHWTQAADDLKGVGDMDWFHAKRQLLGVVMSQGGRCDVQVARQLLQPAGEGVTLEMLFEESSTKNLSKVLFWEPERVFRRREVQAEGQASQLSEEVRQAIVQAVNSGGSATVAEIKAALEAADLASQADDQLLYSTVQTMPELFFMPDLVFLRHMVKGIIAEEPAAQEEPVDEEEAFMLAGLAEVAAAAAALDPPEPEPVPIHIEAPAGGAGAIAAMHSGSTANFFSFGGFEGQAKATHDAMSPPLKRQRLAKDRRNALDEAPAWVTEGAAVRVRSGAQELPGAIVDVCGDSCTVRLASEGSDAGVVEKEFPLPALLPVAPEVGQSVKVVGGDRTGCMGKLVGLAGAEGVVQIGGMQYVTLPMGQLAVLAS
eukprot:TRINITY_DN15995_c0_g2_i1.p1 TRINITY_DN15995_c0_g2~~TRINITY_DN15995_c0_g2_i1.p1  ORF type:complete len:1007 (-),score=272.94 TRINITY_DN15995_c0_g2_i1:63-2756(-)